MYNFKTRETKQTLQNGKRYVEPRASNRACEVMNSICCCRANETAKPDKEQL